MNLFRIPSALLTGALMAAMTLPAAADAIADFYSGKQISLIIGYGTGGGYDLYARLLARFIGDHIPGKPTIVAQNMPGAGSRRAANWLYKVAPKDGTVIATLSQTTPIDQVLDQPGIQFDVQRFNWIGNMVVVNNIMFVSAATGVRTIDDAKKKPLAIGSTGASSPSVLYPQVSNNLFGTKFKIVSGYSGGGDINLAVERREVDGRGSDSWASLKANKPDWLRDRTMVMPSRRRTPPVLSRQSSRPPPAPATATTTFMTPPAFRSAPVHAWYQTRASRTIAYCRSGSARAATSWSRRSGSLRRSLKTS
jgi:hypothetical protein